MEDQWIDVGTAIDANMPVWPDDPRPQITQPHTIGKDGFNLTHVCMGAHTGTHVDAPAHYIEGGATVDQIGMERLIGPAKVFEVPGKVVTAESLLNLDISKGDRLIVKTENSKIDWPNRPFMKDYVYLDESAAQLLVNKGIYLIGVDYLSVGSFDDGERTHRILLGNGIVIVEGLLLANVEPGYYNMICLPMKLKSADGAPARTLLKKMASEEI